MGDYDARDFSLHFESYSSTPPPPAPLFYVNKHKQLVTFDRMLSYACKRNEVTTGRMLEGKPWSSKYMWRDSLRSLAVVVCNSRILFQNCPYSLTANSIKVVVLEKLRVVQVAKISPTLLNLNFHYSFQKNQSLNYVLGKVHSAKVVFHYQLFLCYLPVVELWINILQFYAIVIRCWNTERVWRTDTIN
jgi:hypothetical protein